MKRKIMRKPIRVKEEKSIERDVKYEDVTILGIRQRFCWIPPGEFIMGSPEDESGRVGDERQHEVVISKGFWLADIACTQALWQVVMGENPSRFKGDERSVENVSWEDCRFFFEKVNKAIPQLNFRFSTEAEWEYACRAGTTTRYYSGDSKSDLDRVGWYGENSGGGTHPVGEKEPNQFGLYDMHGNVWEWCEDWYGEYPTDTVVDPKGPEKGGVYRVVRGGSWGSLARYVRAAFRYRFRPDNRFNDLGFRLAMG